MTQESTSTRPIIIHEDGSYTVRGIVVTEDSKSPVVGIDVELWDQDFFQKDDYLGITKTNEQGVFELTFPKEAFHEPIIDTKPDIYFHLLKNGKDVPDLNNLFLKNADESVGEITLVVSEHFK